MNMATLMLKLGDGTHRAVLAPRGTFAHRAEEDAMSKQTKTQKANAAVAKSAKAKKAGRTMTDAQLKRAVAADQNAAAKKRLAKMKGLVLDTATHSILTGEPKARPKKEGGKLSGLDAAAQVLAEAKKPMGAKEMVETMLAKGLWKTDGKTPEATIYAAIIREIATKGSVARFVKTGRGEFAINTPAKA